jgi:transcriptional regulator with XRE-family HTH domain
VRRLREAQGWSQERLAEHADLNRSYIGEIERGVVIASLLTVEKLAGALQVTRPNHRAAHGALLMAIAC